jgi:hypothetical protein
MPTAAQCRQRIRRLNRRELLTLWRQIQAGTTTWWDAGKALEYLILRAFEMERATVTWPYQVSSGQGTTEQIDGAVHADGLRCIFECKDLQRPLDHDAIAVLREQLQRRPAAVFGCVFSTSGFTLPALTLTLRARQDIALWNRDDIDYALRGRKMRPALLAKYRWCAERAIPDLDLRRANI